MSKSVYDINVNLGLKRGRNQWEDELIDKIEAAQRDLGLCPEQKIRNMLMPQSPAAQEAHLQLLAAQPAIELPGQASEKRSEV